MFSPFGKHCETVCMLSLDVAQQEVTGRRSLENKGCTASPCPLQRMMIGRHFQRKNAIGWSVCQSMWRHFQLVENDVPKLTCSFSSLKAVPTSCRLLLFVGKVLFNKSTKTSVIKWEPEMMNTTTCSKVISSLKVDDRQRARPLCRSSLTAGRTEEVN